MGRSELLWQAALEGCHRVSARWPVLAMCAESGDAVAGEQHSFSMPGIVQGLVACKHSGATDSAGGAVMQARRLCRLAQLKVSTNVH